MATKPTTTATGKAQAKPQKPMAQSRPAYIDEQHYDVPMDDSILPTLKVVQSISPEAIKGTDAYVPGAEAGMIINSATKELYDGDDGVVIIPLSVRRYWVEWKPRDAGGGFVASYNSKEDLEAGFTPGNEVQVTIEYLVLIDETQQQSTVRFNTATKYPIARKWAQMIEQAKTMYGKKYRLKSVLKQNKNKQVYHNFDIEALEWVEKTTYNVCKELAASFNAQGQIGNGEV